VALQHSPRSSRTFWLAAIAFGVGALVILVQWLGFAVQSSNLHPLAQIAFHATAQNLLEWENAAGDWFVRNGKKAAVSDQLICLGIDDASTSINQTDLEDFSSEIPSESTDLIALQAMAQPWPWSRTVHALVLEKLMQAGARVVVFDLIFQSETPSDPSFNSLLERHRERVVIGSNFTRVSLPDGQSSWSLTMPADTVVPQTTPVDDRVGYVSFLPDDSSGVIRSALFRNSLASMNGIAPSATDEVYLSLAARTLAKAGLADRIPPGAWPHTLHFADLAQPAFLPRPIYQIFVPRFWKSNFKNGEIFRDKIVMIGPFAEIMHDFVDTPLRRMAGAHLHMQALNAAIQRAFIWRLPPLVQMLTVAFAVMLAFLITKNLHKPIPQFLSLLGGNVFFFALSWFAYNSWQLWPVTIAPLLALNAVGILSIVYELIGEKIERARTRRTLERYVSRNLVRELLDNQQEFLESSMGKRKPVTVLFSDLRGFTSMTEKADPQVLIVQLNQYLSEMVQCVFKREGTLDKFIGDAVMAVWGNVRSLGQTEDARQAVLSALDMRTALVQLNQRWTEAGLQKFYFGVGLNHGEVITGDIGSPEKSEFTVIGDAVNLASRIEGLTKNYGVDLLISQEVVALLGKEFLLQSVDHVKVKGKGEPTEVFAVHQKMADPVAADLSDYLDRYHRALASYRRAEFTAAVEAFSELLTTHPEDSLTKLYLKRCQEFISHPPAADWDGVFTMQTK